MKINEVCDSLLAVGWLHPSVLKPLQQFAESCGVLCVLETDPIQWCNDQLDSCSITGAQVQQFILTVLWSDVPVRHHGDQCLTSLTIHFVQCLIANGWVRLLHLRPWSPDRAVLGILRYLSQMDKFDRLRLISITWSTWHPVPPESNRWVRLPSTDL